MLLRDPAKARLGVGACGVWRLGGVGAPGRGRQIRAPRPPALAPGAWFSTGLVRALRHRLPLLSPSRHAPAFHVCAAAHDRGDHAHARGPLQAAVPAPGAAAAGGGAAGAPSFVSAQACCFQRVPCMCAWSLRQALRAASHNAVWRLQVPTKVGCVANLPAMWLLSAIACFPSLCSGRSSPSSWSRAWGRWVLPCMGCPMSCPCLQALSGCPPRPRSPLVQDGLAPHMPPSPSSLPCPRP